MIIVFGSINLDLIFPVPFLPQHGDTVLADEGRVEPGGKGANQAVAAALDGGRVVMVGAVGRDLLARQAMEGLERAGVDVSRVARLDADTGRACICVDPQGHNTITVAAGANARAHADQVEPSLLTSRATVVLQMEVPPAQSAALIRRARKAGSRIVLNLAPARMIDVDVLQQVDLLIGNSNEIAWLGEHLGTGTNAASIYAALNVATIRTLGVQGAEIASTGGYWHMPALTVDARDSTGAGDTFVGVLASALQGGLAMTDALRRAGTAAALSATRLGSQGSVPQGVETDAALVHAPLVSAREPQISD